MELFFTKTLHLKLLALLALGIFLQVITLKDSQIPTVDTHTHPNSYLAVTELTSSPLLLLCCTDSTTWGGKREWGD